MPFRQVTCARSPVALLVVLFMTVFASLGASPRSVEPEEEQLIGWRGNSYKPQEPRRTWMQLVSWKPRAYILHNLLTEAEAQHIVELSWPQMRRSTVVGENGSAVLDDYRTSYGTFISRYQTPVIAGVQKRVAFFTRLPVVNQEDMQVLRYGVGQYYHKHTDSLDNDSPRLATLLIYLADPEEGGETSFPDGSVWVDPRMAEEFEPQFSECARGHVAFKPRRGDGLLFFSIAPDGRTEDPHSMHEGCPILKGAKWTTTVWIHSVPFRPNEFRNETFSRGETPVIDPGVCSDTHPQCKEWAAAGECDANPVYMKGGFEQLGACTRSCGVCEPCTEEDKREQAPCYWRNRRKQGYLVFEPKELLFRRVEGS